jgi:hypothetical protein
MALVTRGLSDCEVARGTGVPRGTIRDWSKGLHARRAAGSAPACPSCDYPGASQALPRLSCAYLLGMYLGDGSIDRLPRTWRLRIALDMGWRGIMRECASAMKAVFRENRVRLYQADSRSRCAVARVYSNHLVCLFPQHGPGAKHLRPIELADWQTDLVNEQPQQFLRGLIHSDGCRFTNRVRASGKGLRLPALQLHERLRRHPRPLHIDVRAAWDRVAPDERPEHLDREA